MIQTKEFMDNVSQWADICLNDERIDLGLYEKYEVKRGLRDKNGNGIGLKRLRICFFLVNYLVTASSRSSGKAWHSAVRFPRILSGTL